MCPSTVINLLIDFLSRQAPTQVLALRAMQEHGVLADQKMLLFAQSQQGSTALPNHLLILAKAVQPDTTARDLTQTSWNAQQRQDSHAHKPALQTQAALGAQ